MPFITTRTNVSISDAKRSILEKKLGKAIELIPGKTEDWLMLAFQPDTPMCFQGSEAPAAFVEVKIFGSTTAEAYAAETEEICEILTAELDIPGERIYVRYEEGTLWGWNGANF